MANEVTGVDGCLALLKGIQDLAQDYQAVMADGKVDMSDLKVAADLFSQFGELKAAVTEFPQIGGELKALTDAEIAQLAAAALAIYHVFKPAQA